MDKYKNLENHITFGPSKSTKGRKLKKLKQESDEDNEIIIEKKNIDDNKYEKIDGNLFKYEGIAIHIIYENDKPWFRGKDVALILEYKDTKQAVNYNIDKLERKKYGDFVLDIQGRKITPLEKSKKIQKNTIYISKRGMFNLILESKAKGAKKFKKWISGLLEQIDNGENIYEDDQVAPETTFNKFNPEYEEYIKYNSACDIRKHNVLYLGAIGIVNKIGVDTNVKTNEPIYKFGITERGVVRENEHKSNIDNFITFYVKKCVYNKRLEDDLKFELRTKGLLRYCRSNGVKYTELFTVSDAFTLENIKEFIEKWVIDNEERYKTEAVLLAEEATKQKALELEQKQEETKQKSIELEQIHANIELLKLQMEFSKKVKK